MLLLVQLIQTWFRVFKEFSALWISTTTTSCQFSSCSFCLEAQFMTFLNKNGEIIHAKISQIFSARITYVFPRWTLL